MMDRAHHPSIQQPLARFRAFWAELDAVVDEIRQQKWSGPAEAPATAAPDRDPRQHAVDLLFRRLREAVLAHGGAPAPRSAYGAAPIDLGYIMAALADETLLYLDAWDGMALWSRTLLEERIYGTRSAGERLYDEIDVVLARRTGEQDEIAVGLLLALSLGFRGRHRLFANAADIEAEADRLRGRLYQAIFYRDPPVRPDWQTAMGYPPPFEAGRLIRLPRLRPWIGAIAAAVLVYLVAGHLIWLHSFGDLMDIADRVADNGTLGQR
jgi:type IV/VI secretion system ImpK/VasF family protein